jgi:hypothetical protein
VASVGCVSAANSGGKSADNKSSASSPSKPTLSASPNSSRASLATLNLGFRCQTDTNKGPKPPSISKHTRRYRT